VSTEFYWVAVVVTTVLSVARLTRLFVYDDFPPIAWVRAQYKVRNEGSDWQLLATCGFCASFWVALVIFFWGWIAGVYEGHTTNDDAGTVWWVFNAIFAIAYVAASYVARDGDES
jgi:sterol desaturase/sphingolipid hydroxylase (fatty acid hydroxylase superfamily)